MDNSIFVLLLLVAMFVLIALGQYIHSVLLTVGIFGVLVLLGGWDKLGGFLRQDPFNTVASFGLTTVPLFVLMAQFVMQSGLVKDLYLVFFKVSGGRPAALGAMTVIGGGMLGAVAGSGVATSAALGQVAVPEMRRYGFSRDLASAIAASAGSLSAIMPPSIILIIYGSVAQVSIGRIFVAALIPAVLMTTVFIFCSLAYLRLEQIRSKAASGNQAPVEIGAASATSSKSIKVDQNVETITLSRLLVLSGYGALMVTVIFGGIYSGVLTPTEAGGVGASVSLLLALLLRRVNLEFMLTSVVESVRISAMVLFIMIGAQLFGRFISLSLVPRRLIALLEPLLDRPLIVLSLIVAALFFLFMIIEGAAVIVMAVPILLPLVVAVGFDPVWFGVVVGVVGTVGLLTPPVGLAVYGLVGVTGSSPERVFRITTAFALAATIIVGGALMVFPQVALWLPSRM